MIKAIRYPLRKVHLGLVVWFSDDVNFGNEFVRLERFLELADHMDAGSALFVAADRVSGWGWIPLGANATEPVERVRRFVVNHDEAPYVALGEALQGVDGFRRSHRQAQNAHRVAVAAASSTPRVTAFSDQGLSAAALMGTDISDARAWVGEVSDRWRPTRTTTRCCARRSLSSCVSGAATKPPPSSCTCTSTR